MRESRYDTSIREFNIRDDGLEVADSFESAESILWGQARTAAKGDVKDMKTILIVDDEFDLTCTLKAVLEHHVYRAETCSNGREAIDSIEKNRPDLMIFDVMMPLGNGFDVLQRIRCKDELADLPVVLTHSVLPLRHERCNGSFSSGSRWPSILS